MKTGTKTFMFLLIRTTGEEPPVARYVPTKERAWEIIRDEIRIVAEEAGIIDDKEIEEHVTEYPDSAVIEFWYDETVNWNIIDVNEIEIVE